MGQIFFLLRVNSRESGTENENLAAEIYLRQLITLPRSYICYKNVHSEQTGIIQNVSDNFIDI